MPRSLRLYGYLSLNGYLSLDGYLNFDGYLGLYGCLSLYGCLNLDGYTVRPSGKVFSGETCIPLSSSFGCTVSSRFLRFAGYPACNAGFHRC